MSYVNGSAHVSGTHLSWTDFNDAQDQDQPIAMLHPIEGLTKDQIKEKILQHLDQALFYLFPKGETRRQQFLIGDIHGNEGESLKVERKGSKAGQWYDFATGEGGDIVDLWGAARGYDAYDARTRFPDVLRDMETWLGQSSLTESPIMGLNPFKGSVCEPPRPQKKRQREDLGSYTDKWDYRDATGKLIACTYRYDTPKGKEFRPWDVKSQQHRFPDPRPLYNQPGLLHSDSVIVVEGEKCAEALISVSMCATTAMGGANAPLEKTDWSPLAGKHVLLWPDNDAPGQEYASKVFQHLHGQSLLSLSLVHLPDDLPEKWDAADAVAEGRDIEVFLQNNAKKVSRAQPLEVVQPLEESNETSALKEKPSPIPHQFFGQWLDEVGPMADDLIAPRILTPGGILLFGGAPKVGKTDFMLNWVVRMSAGLPFLGMMPSRPLKIFYLQTEIDHDYLWERLKQMDLDKDFLPLMRENLVITDSVRILLNEEGIERLKLTIAKCFVPDVIVVDPLRNVYPGASENDNMEMMTFLQDRIKFLKDSLNPHAAVIIVHHTRKIGKSELTEDPFNAFSGASVLRSFYTSGVMLYRVDEKESLRHLHFELRNGQPVPLKLVDKVEGKWCEMDVSHERTVRQDYGQKLDKERERIWDAILQLIYDEARKGQLYTPLQFSQNFINGSGLGGRRAIYDHIDDLCTMGYIKFNKEEEGFRGSKYGAMCVENMSVPLEKPVEDPETGEIIEDRRRVLPTHFKDVGNGKLYPVENSEVWVYRESMTEINKKKKE